MMSIVAHDVAHDVYSPLLRVGDSTTPGRTCRPAGVATRCLFFAVAEGSGGGVRRGRSKAGALAFATDGVPVGWELNHGMLQVGA